jgi:hypothetical protein
MNIPIEEIFAFNEKKGVTDFGVEEYEEQKEYIVAPSKNTLSLKYGQNVFDIDEHDEAKILRASGGKR